MNTRKTSLSRRIDGEIYVAHCSSVTDRLMLWQIREMVIDAGRERIIPVPYELIEPVGRNYCMGKVRDNDVLDFSPDGKVVLVRSRTTIFRGNGHNNTRDEYYLVIDGEHGLEAIALDCLDAQRALQAAADAPVNFIGAAIAALHAAASLKQERRYENS